MTNEIELLRRFRDETPVPSTDAWTRARTSIATVRAEERDASTVSIIAKTRRIANSVSRGPHSKGQSRSRTFRRPRAFVVQSTVVCVVVLAGVLVSVLGGRAALSSPFHSKWSVAHALPATHTHVQAPKGTWSLVSDITDQGWQQHTAGPEPGSLTCPTASACYVLGDNASSDAGPATYNSFYVSHDGALSWSVLPVPTGVDFTTTLACADALNCAAGATYDNQPAYISTSNGGHSFTVDPLPTSDGTLYSLDCPSVSFCAGLAAASGGGNNTPTDATFLSTTTNGASFSNAAFPAGQSMTSLVCSTVSNCVAVGTSDAQNANGSMGGVVASTSDAGQSWTSGAFPVGFDMMDYSTQLSCSDAEHCSVLGNIVIATVNSSPCSMTPPLPPPPQPAPSTPPAQSSAVRAIAQEESTYWTQSNAAEAAAGIITCSGNATTIISDIAETSDGGLTWVPEALPSSAPQPILSDIVCPSSEVCVATGTVAVPQKFASGALNGGSAIVLTTNNDGATWSSVSFAVPSNIPSGVQLDAFMAVGSVQCPQLNYCIALGVSNQGSKTTPVYTSGSSVQSANTA
jgi:hypothetical protein